MLVISIFLQGYTGDHTKRESIWIRKHEDDRKNIRSYVWNISHVLEGDEEQQKVSQEQLLNEWEKLVQLVKELHINHGRVSDKSNLRDVYQELQQVARLSQELKTLIHDAEEASKTSRTIMKQYPREEHPHTDHDGDGHDE